MNTVLSGITKYLRKLENHTNALAVNLLDNTETTHRLIRYTVCVKMVPKSLGPSLTAGKKEIMVMEHTAYPLYLAPRRLLPLDYHKESSQRETF
jgi:hypothetical protein